MEIFIQITGWIGTCFIVLAYFLVSSKKVDGNNKAYQLLNLIGAIAVGINVFQKQVWSTFVLEIIWGGIALKSLLLPPKN